MTKNALRIMERIREILWDNFGMEFFFSFSILKVENEIENLLHQCISNRQMLKCCLLRRMTLPRFF